MAGIFEYFVVCGIGPEIRTLEGEKGFHGVLVMYLPSLLDQYPPPNHTLYPPPPPQLPTVSYEFHSSCIGRLTLSRVRTIYLMRNDCNYIVIRTMCTKVRNGCCELVG